MKRYFVTGIGTNVGKTVVSAILTEALNADYWKPVQSGSIEGRDTDTVRNLISNKTSAFHPETYLLKEPASPHLAAKKENILINTAKLQLPFTSNSLIIEGAGGLLVPLNNSDYVIDLAKQFNASVVLVVSNYLGCINHTLLSIEYLLQNNYKFQGIILNGKFEEDVKSAIVNYKNVKVLAEIPNDGKVDQQFVSEQALKIKKELF